MNKKDYENLERTGKASFLMVVLSGLIGAVKIVGNVAKKNAAAGQLEEAQREYDNSSWLHKKMNKRPK